MNTSSVRAERFILPPPLPRLSPEDSLATIDGIETHPRSNSRPIDSAAATWQRQARSGAELKAVAFRPHIDEQTCATAAYSRAALEPMIAGKHWERAREAIRRSDRELHTQPGNSTRWPPNSAETKSLVRAPRTT